MGIILLIGWMWTIHDDRGELVGIPAGSIKDGVPAPCVRLVGRVTGLVNCQWVDTKTEVFDRDAVALDQEFALVSGLLEITYDSGAKVILQGPCT